MGGNTTNTLRRFKMSNCHQLNLKSDVLQFINFQPYAKRRRTWNFHQSVSGLDFAHGIAIATPQRSLIDQHIRESATLLPRGDIGA